MDKRASRAVSRFSQAAETRVMGQSESYTPQYSGQSYESQTPAPIIRQAPRWLELRPVLPPVPQAQNAQYSDQSRRLRP